MDTKVLSVDKIKDQIAEYEHEIRDLQVKADSATGTEKTKLEREISVLKIKSGILRLR